MKLKIAISGKMRAGKDYVCNLIQTMYQEKRYQRKAFADELKNMVYQNFGVTKEHINGRKILQLYGQIGRLVDDLFWVQKATSNTKKDDNIIITDLRYKNEANFLKIMGYKLIRVNANYETRLSRGKLEYEDDTSETDLDDYVFDYYINNSNDIAQSDLEKEIKNILG